MWKPLMTQPHRTRVPNLQDLMPNDLMWIWCNNNINKVHDKCNVPEASWNHLFLPFHGKLSSLKLVPGAKKVGDRCHKTLRNQHEMYNSQSLWFNDFLVEWLVSSLCSEILWGQELWWHKANTITDRIKLHRSICIYKIYSSVGKEADLIL